MNYEKRIANVKSTIEIEQIFEEIYNQYKNLVFHITLQYVKNKEDAKEICNDVFINFFNRINKIDFSMNIKYYLTVSAKNLSLNFLKKKKEEVMYDDEIILQAESSSSYKDDWDLLINHFKDFLTEEELNICTLHLLYNFTFQEISNMYNTKLTIISSKYNYALKKIKKHYKL